MSILEDYIKMSLLAGHNNIRNLTVHQAAGGFARNRQRGATKFMWDAVDWLSYSMYSLLKRRWKNNGSIDRHSCIWRFNIRTAIYIK
jgi:hypothetical protein